MPRKCYRVASLDDSLTPRRPFRTVTRALREATALSRGDKRIAVWGSSGETAEVVAIAFNGEVYVSAKQSSSTATDGGIVYDGQRFHPFSLSKISGTSFTWERIPIGLVGLVFLVGTMLSLWLAFRTDRSSSEYIKYGGGAVLFGILAFAHLRAAVTGRIPRWLEALADAGA